MIKVFFKFISSGFGLGYSKKAPGTVGSIGFFLLFYPLISQSITIKVIISISVIIIGLIAIKNSINKNEDDPQWIVIDEFAGLSVALILSSNIYSWIASLILFRIFDITKILGVRKVEELPNPYGIMFDDVLAGIYSLVIIFLFQCIIF